MTTLDILIPIVGTAVILALRVWRGRYHRSE